MRRGLTVLLALSLAACGETIPVPTEPSPPEPTPSLTGKWAGDLGRRGIGNWTRATLALVDTGSEISGVLTNGRGKQWRLAGSPVAGSTRDRWILHVVDIPGTSTCPLLQVVIDAVERSASGAATALLGTLGGRCYGTVAEDFRLERVAA